MSDRQAKPPGAARTAFDAATPKAFTRAGRNGAAISALGGIERRAERIKARAVAHYKKFEDRWVAKESIRVWQRQLKSQAGAAAPSGEIPSANVEAIARLAARNVKARTNRRLTKINAMKVRMSNALVRSLEQPAIKREFNRAAPEKSPRRSITQ